MPTFLRFTFLAAHLKFRTKFEVCCRKYRFTTKLNTPLIKKVTLSTKAMGSEDYVNIVKKSIRSYPDFPKPGIVFRDIFSLMKNPEALEALNKLILEQIDKIAPKPDVIIGLESRGFLFGPLISLQTGIPFVPIRKKGKLPGKVNKEDYVLEYGVDTVEIQSESIQEGQSVVIVDDLLATGGTLQAACKLVLQLGVRVKQCIVVMELLDLKGRSAVEAPIHSIIQY